PIGELFALLSSDPLVAHVAEHILMCRGGLEEVSADTWLSLLERGEAFTPLCQRYLSADQVPTEQAVRLAASGSAAAVFAWEQCVEPRLARGELAVDLLLSLLDSPRADRRSVMAAR